MGRCGAAGARAGHPAALIFAFRALSFERSLRLIFLNRFFHPDHSATSQMLSDLAFALAEQGNAVCVITSRQRYDAPADTLPPKEVLDGVCVHRVWSTRFGRVALVGRAIDYLTFYLSAAWCLWRLARTGDTVVAKTDPPMLSVTALPVCRLRGARLVNWLQDIFPETAEALGVGGPVARVPYRLMRWLRNGSLRAADMNVVLGERMANRVAALGVRSECIRIIPNWADGGAVAPVEPPANRMRAEWGLADAFVVAYSGNLGRAHAIETLLEAMSLTARQTTPPDPAGKPRPVTWLFIGGGALLEPLKIDVVRRGLTSVHFKPYQARGLLAQSLSVADVHLVSLRPELEGLIVPSKFYGVAAAGRPTIFIGDRNGEIAHILARTASGLSIAEGDGRALARAIMTLAADPARCTAMGRAARRSFESEFDRPHALARWQALLHDTAQLRSRTGRGRPGFRRRRLLDAS